MVDLPDGGVLGHEHAIPAPKVRGVTTEDQGTHRLVLHHEWKHHHTHGSTWLFHVKYNTALFRQIGLHGLAHGFDTSHDTPYQGGEILVRNVALRAQAPEGGDRIR